MHNDLLDLYRRHVDDLTAGTTAALEAAGYDAVVIHSGSPIKRSVFDDQFWPLRGVPHFQHWAHLQWPDCALYLAVGEGPKLLHLRSRDFWERPREPDWSALGAALALVELKSVEALPATIATNRKTAYVGEDLARGGAWGFDEPDRNPEGLLAALDELRVTKTQYEIACLDRANQIAATGHKAVADAFAGGERSELELHLIFLQATQQDDPETPYKNIVAIGENAAILHHVHYHRETPARQVQSLLLDAGATVRGYASDVTRTHVAGSDDASASTFAQLLAGLETLQLAICDEVKVGKPYERLHDQAHEHLGQVLTDAGVWKASPTACVEQGVTRMFLPHGLGHSLGLQCHDVGCATIKPREDNPFLRNTRVIEPNQVFTIEPGVYFIDSFMESLAAKPEGESVDWKLVEALQPFGGIRIEDDVVVGDGDIENLTRKVL